MEEEKKVMELCALPKEFIINQINKLVEANKEAFETYDYLIKALNSPVQTIPTEEIKEEVTQEAEVLAAEE